MRITLEVDTNDLSCLGPVMETTGQLLAYDCPGGVGACQGEYEVSERWMVRYRVDPIYCSQGDAEERAYCTHGYATAADCWLDNEYPNHEDEK